MPIRDRERYNEYMREYRKSRSYSKKFRVIVQEWETKPIIRLTKEQMKNKVEEGFINGLEKIPSR